MTNNFMPYASDIKRFRTDLFLNNEYDIELKNASCYNVYKSIMSEIDNNICNSNFYSLSCELLETQFPSEGE